MNAIPTLTPQIDRWADCDMLDAPEWQISPSPFDWQIMIYGGENPRTGRPQEPQAFQFFGKHYSARAITVKARDMAERQHRQHFIIRPPTNELFIKPPAKIKRRAAARKGERFNAWGLQVRP